jgi:hypothetical protein
MSDHAHMSPARTPPRRAALETQHDGSTIHTSSVTANLADDRVGMSFHWSHHPC